MNRISALRIPPSSPLTRGHERLCALEEAARVRGDEAALSVAACARAIEGAVPQALDARFQIVEAAVRAIEGGVASSVGAQAQAATAILEHVSRWPTLAARWEGARRAVQSLAERAAATGAPEQRNARFLADIAEVVESPQGMLTTMGQLTPADVDRLGWYVATARSGALPGVMCVGERAQAGRVVKMGLDELRGHGGHPHLARMASWQEGVTSPLSRLMIRYHTLELIDEGVTPGAEAGLVLAHKVGRWGKLPAADKAFVRETAIAEARAAAPAEGDYRRWLDFHEAARTVPGGQALQEMTIQYIMWGLPTQPSSLDSTLIGVLRGMAPDADNRAAVAQALGTLLPREQWRDWAGDALKVADRCAKYAPAWEAPVLEMAVDAARTAKEPAVPMLLAVLDASTAERTAALRHCLDQLLRVGEDRVQDALTSTGAATGGVKTEDDCVVIGGIRVPRRVAER